MSALDANGTRHPSHPIRAGAAVFVAAYLVLAATMVGLGTVITQRFDEVTRWDISINRWFVRQRVGWLDTVTMVGSHLAETLTVIGLGLLVAVLLWRFKDWDSIGLLVVALGLEVTVFLTTTLLVDRTRPPVPRLDGAPPTSSFPSGHTAAAVALYAGLAVILHRRIRRGIVRVVATVFLLALPVAVAMSRLYRGMHYPTDVMAGVLLGAACLLLAGYAVRAMRARRSDPRPTVSIHSSERPVTAPPTRYPVVDESSRLEGVGS